MSSLFRVIAIATGITAVVGPQQDHVTRESVVSGGQRRADEINRQAWTFLASHALRSDPKYDAHTIR